MTSQLRPAGQRFPATATPCPRYSHIEPNAISFPTSRHHRRSSLTILARAARGGAPPSRPSGRGSGSSSRGSSSRPQQSRQQPRQQPQQQQRPRDPPVRQQPKKGTTPAGVPVREGMELELECARLALEGKGVCLLPPTGFVVLVERTLPGERVRAEVVTVKRGYAEARKLASLAPHRHAVPPPCPYFGPCGGCTLQSLDYEAQLREKRNQVEQTLRRVGRLGPSLDQIAAAAAEGGGSAEGAGAGGGVASTIGCREPFGYRNKMTFHFSARCWVPTDGDEAVVDRPALGFLRPGSPDVVIPVVGHGCKLQGSLANAILARVSGLVSEHGLLPYNHLSGEGSLKQLLIRRGVNSTAPGPSAAATTGADSEALVVPQGEELMVIFGVTRGSDLQKLKTVAAALAAEFPQLVSIVAQQVPAPLPPSRSVVPKDSRRGGGGGGGGRGRGDGPGRGRRGQTSSFERPVVADDDGAAAATGSLADLADDDADVDSGNGAVTLLHGRSYIYDTLGGLRFCISPGSFFQTNSGQAEVLYDIVRQAAGLRPGAVDDVVDLYCGTGTIGLSLAPECRTVVGLDVVESAVSDARRNAALNGITNATFIRADVDNASASLELRPPAGGSSAAADNSCSPPDVVIVDPARSGLSAGAVTYLAGCGARRVVYVSCNVATQARDLDRLCNGRDAAFRLVRVQPVDMFPHTDHVETVAVLERKEGA